MIEEQLPKITCLFFINNLRFLIANESVSKIAKTLKKVEQIALK